MQAFQLLEYQWRWREGKFDKLTPSSLPPLSMFMTEVTSMIASTNGLFFVHVGGLFVVVGVGGLILGPYPFMGSGGQFQVLSPV